MTSCPSAFSKIGQTLLRGLSNSLSHSAVVVSTELLLVEAFDFDILLNLNLKGATLNLILLCGVFDMDSVLKFIVAAEIKRNIRNYTQNRLNIFKRKLNMLV